MMDNVYDLVTQKKNSDYPPLTEAQKEEMSEDEIKDWEKMVFRSWWYPGRDGGVYEWEFPLYYLWNHP